MPRSGQVVIVGAGIGGLACAIDLARRGVEVTVAEAAAAPGGKMRDILVGGRPIDSGPTVLTLKSVFDELFADAGASLDGRLRLQKAQVLARHAWPGGARMDLFADLERSADEIGRFAGSADAAGFRTFSAWSRRIFETLDGAFMRRQTTGPLGLVRRVGVTRLGEIAGLRPYDTLWAVLGECFADPRLRQLFGRYATYCGSSPFAAPATLMLIAHAERQGVWLVEGGMQRLAEAMETLARELGARFRYQAPVERIDVARGRAAGVTLRTGERLAADAVVMNGDPQAVATGLLGPEAARAVTTYRSDRRSLSALTWSIVARAGDFPLSRHNVFFSDDYPGEFDDLMGRGRTPESPTIYVCAQDRDDGGCAPHGEERLLALINAPANGDQCEMDETELRSCERRLYQQLERCGLKLEPPTASVVTTPSVFATMFPASGGALYGAATHGSAAAFRRPGARSRVPGLYLAGGGAHPGAGLPMVALSGRLAAERVMADLASTRTSRRAATSGGTSTPAATTA
jgi:1-hydroxycarotenoid 3,4-desaturase